MAKVKPQNCCCFSIEKKGCETDSLNLLSIAMVTFKSVTQRMDFLLRHLVNTVPVSLHPKNESHSKRCRTPNCH